MNCLRCGRKIPEGKAFCRECSETVSTPQSEMLNTHITLPLRPPEPKKTEPTKMKPPKPERKSPKWMRVMLVVVSCLCLMLAAALSLLSAHFFGESYRQEQAQLRQKAEELTQTNLLLEQSQTELEAALQEQTALREQLNERAKEIRSLNEQLNSYHQQSSDAQENLENAESQNSELSQKVEDYEEQLSRQADAMEALQEKMDELSAANRALQTKSSFVDAHVVFVENDGTSLYHTYSCPKFKKADYWAYNLNLAIDKGLKACPYCH